MTTIKKIDGGIVKEVILLSIAGQKRIAVTGVWSGGKWGAHDQFSVRVFRKGVLLDTFQVVSVQMIAQRDAILILSPDQKACLPAKGDLLLFKEGAFTMRDVYTTNLPINRDGAIEIGYQHYHGIAIAEQGAIHKIIFFHPVGAGLDPGEQQPVWWQGEQFSVQMAVQEIAYA